MRTLLCGASSKSMLRDTVPCARQRRWLGFPWRHPRDLTDHLRTGCYSPLLRPDDLLNLQVDAHNLALDTSDPQQPLLTRVTEGESALVIVRHQVVSSGHPTAQDNISSRKKP